MTLRCFQIFVIAIFLQPFVTEASEWPKNKGYKFTSEWFDNERIQLWSKHLAPFKNKPNVQYLEVGLWEGRSFLWALDHIFTHPTSTAVGVDKFMPHIEATFRENLKKSGQSKRVKVLVERSEHALRNLKPLSFDVIYIDGGHNIKTVLIDTVNAWPLLKPNGVLIFDDYKMHDDRFPESLRPRMAIDTFLRGFANEIKVLEKGTQVLVQKLPEPGPWCHSCSWFGPYFYEWYEQTLYPQVVKNPLKLKPEQTKELEDILRKMDAAKSDKEREEMKESAIRLAKKLHPVIK